jgi:hypothetical protein
MAKGSSAKQSKIRGAWDSPGIGPSPMTARERKRFFAFYKKHKSRRLFGFFRDITKSSANNAMLARYLSTKKSAECLIMGCSHWANPNDLEAFVRSYNKMLRINVVVLDVLPDSLVEGIRHHVHCLPLVTPAQTTPFLDDYFDIIVADGLLNCCGFEQHEPIIKEMHRVAKQKAIILLGLAHFSRNVVVKPAERAMEVHCRPLEDFKTMFVKSGFRFPANSSIETSLSKGSEIRIDNCMARK